MPDALPTSTLTLEFGDWAVGLGREQGVDAIDPPKRPKHLHERNQLDRLAALDPLHSRSRHTRDVSKLRLSHVKRSPMLSHPPPKLSNNLSICSTTKKHDYSSFISANTP